MAGSINWEVIVLGRLLRYFLPSPPPPPDIPPVSPPPAVSVTPPSERQQIDRRLHAHEARLAQLQAIASLDELRSRSRGGADALQ